MDCRGHRGSVSPSRALPRAWVAGARRQVFVDRLWVALYGHTLYARLADGISRVLVFCSQASPLSPACSSVGTSICRTNQFFAFYLALIGGVYGVFLSGDLFLLFVFYEIAIVPKYFLISIWGSTRREYAAMKLALYSFVGSAMVLIGLLAAYTMAGSHSTTLGDLAHAGLPVSFQMWCFPLVFVGFAILAGMWPFHTWAPTGHVAAPTAASMLLAGVVMKLGAYGCLRVGIGSPFRTASIPGDSHSSASVRGATSLRGSPSSASSMARWSPLRKPTSNLSSATPASATWALCFSAS